LVEKDCKDLKVIVVKGLHADVELILVEGNARLIQDHKQLLEAVIIGQQLRIRFYYFELMIPLLFHLEGKNLSAQLEVVLPLEHLYFLSVRSSLTLFNFFADFPLGPNIQTFSLIVGTASKF
jgi:hypothetical protein